MYYHNPNVKEPREDHLAWHGMVLAIDDPWWDTHTPPNGWGCRCEKRMLSQRDMERRGLSASDSPTVVTETVTVGERGPNPRTVQVPKGIDPGFAYNPGKAAFGQILTRQPDPRGWEPLSTHSVDYKTPADYGRPERIPAEKTKLKPVTPSKTQEAFREALVDAMGAESRVFNSGGVPIVIDASTVAYHIVDLGRSAYLPFILDTIENPFEVWRYFEKHKETGKVRLRTRILKSYALDNGRSILVAADGQKGAFQAWTVFQTSDQRYFNRQRSGVMVYGR